MTERKVPKRRHIEEALRNRMEAHRPDDSLPSATQLFDMFDVSRMTARPAV